MKQKEQTITSKDNPLFKKLRLLLSAKGIKEHKLFFLMGDKLIKEFTKSKNKSFKVHLVICSDKYTAKFPFNTITLSQDLFNELDVLGTHYPLFVLEADDFPLIDLNQKPDGIEVVLPMGDPRNLGALARSAVGFGINKIILTQEACHPFLPHAVKASAGAVLKAQFHMTNLKTNELPVVGENFALELNGTDISNQKWPKNFRLWLGEEGPGLRLDAHQLKTIQLINIPTDNIESLNASVSAAISFWEIKKNLSKF